MGRVHERVLRRPMEDRLEGVPVQAVYQRGGDGMWRVLVLVQDEDGRWLCVLVRSPWRPTRLHASRWLDYRTRTA